MKKKYPNQCVGDGDLLEVLFSFCERGMNLRGDLLEMLEHFGDGC